MGHRSKGTNRVEQGANQHTAYHTEHLTCILDNVEDRWVGNWSVYEKHAVELIPVSTKASDKPTTRTDMKRWDVLTRYIQQDRDVIGVEVGVYLAETSKVLLKQVPGLTLYMIDPWLDLGNEDYVTSGDHVSDLDDAAHQLNFEKARHAVGFAKERARILRMDSNRGARALLKVAPQVHFVFIDADHSEGAVAKDIERYWPLVEPGGFLSGHDYDYPINGRENFGPGVKRVVDSFAKREGLELVLEDDYVWLVRKPIETQETDIPEAYEEKSMERPRSTDPNNADNIAYHKSIRKEFVNNITKFPEDTFSGRGIVICAGGTKYFPCAWVALKQLRALGCELPVEIWYLGPFEMDQRMIDILRPLGATCIDAQRVSTEHPARRLFGWELNPYSIIHSSFEEVIFLDADNVVVEDPSFLLDCPEYVDKGAIFWPDFRNLEKHRSIWDICDVVYRDEAEFETGQIVVHKRRCWAELQLTMHINEYSDFYYKHIHGDKDTFHMAWHMLQTPYAMPSRRIHALRHTMCQHDFDDRRIFQHRNMDKWRLDGTNTKIPGFVDEANCLSFLAELRDQWDGTIKMPMPVSAEGTRLHAQTLKERLFTYERVGHDQRTIELLPEGRIGQGAATMERLWYIDDSQEGPPCLVIIGNSVTCKATMDSDEGIWTGSWVNHEQMAVSIIPKSIMVTARSAGTDLIAKVAGTNGRRYLYHRVQHDKRIIELLPDGTIGLGSADIEKVWEILLLGKREVLRIGPALDKPICELTQRRKDGAWVGKWNEFERMPIELSLVSDSPKTKVPVIEKPTETVAMTPDGSKWADLPTPEEPDKTEAQEPEVTQGDQLMFVAVDFDGTIARHEFPEIGEEIPGAIETMLWLQSKGVKLILHTMRSDYRDDGRDYLREAVEWCSSRGIIFYGVNENPTQGAWTGSPKSYANLYIDDAAVGCPLIYPAESEGRPYVDWSGVRQHLEVWLSRELVGADHTNELP